jgi:TPR repeat protein
MRALSITVLFALSLLASGGASAASLTAANTAFDQKNYSRAFELYEPPARTGDVSAQSAIGSMYYFGDGVEKNWTRAYMWFSLAAQSASATGIVAGTNRDVMGGRMISADIKLAKSLAEQCLASNYRQCGSIRYAGR